MPTLTLQRKREAFYSPYRHSTPPHHLGGVHTDDADFSAEVCEGLRVSHFEFPFLPRGRKTSSPGINCPLLFFVIQTSELQIKFHNGSLPWTIPG